MQEEQKYIDKKECERRGYVKIGKLYYRMTVLEKYLHKGWLDFGDRRYTGLDRFQAGEKLAEDYVKCRFAAGRSSDWGKERVDGTPLKSEDLDGVCRARDRYFAVIKAVPKEFWPAVRKVCLENREIAVEEELPARRKQEMMFALKQDLCRGLDRLAEVYAGTKKYGHKI